MKYTRLKKGQRKCSEDISNFYNNNGTQQYINFLCSLIMINNFCSLIHDLVLTVKNQSNVIA